MRMPRKLSPGSTLNSTQSAALCMRTSGRAALGPAFCGLVLSPARVLISTGWQRARRCQAERWGVLGRHKHEDVLGPVFKEEKEETLVPIMPEEHSSTACKQMLGLQERIPRLGS